MSKCRLVLGLGSNIEAIKHLREALSEIKKIEQVQVLKLAKIYESEALIPDGAPASWQKTYLNSAVEIEVLFFEPLDFLKKLKTIETKIGRKPSEKWAPRIIDIDILWCDQISFDSDLLTIPHKELFNRPFALLPVLELKPELKQLIAMPDWIQHSVKPFHTEKSKNFVWPKLVGILNITEDSFSGDGLAQNNSIHATQYLHQLCESGADIVDIGAESTRPGASTVTAEVELARLQKTLGIVFQYKKDFQKNFEVSIDCRKPEVMKKILNHYPIDYLNDVEGFHQPAMQELLKMTSAKAVCMHSLSVPPVKTEVIPDHTDLKSYFTNWWNLKLEELSQLNISSDRLIFDPGIGFGKSARQSFQILNDLSLFTEIKEEIYLGYSRKSFLLNITDKPASDRDPETARVTAELNQAFAQYIRVHNVGLNKASLQ